jgi:hypothetical protein
MTRRRALGLAAGVLGVLLLVFGFAMSAQLDNASWSDSGVPPVFEALTLAALLVGAALFLGGLWFCFRNDSTA